MYIYVYIYMYICIYLYKYILYIYISIHIALLGAFMQLVNIEHEHRGVHVIRQHCAGAATPLTNQMNPSVHMRSSDQLHECPLGHTYQCCQSSLSKVVAFGHNELWRQKAATVTSKLDKISPNGNTAEELRGPGDNLTSLATPPPTAMEIPQSSIPQNGQGRSRLLRWPDYWWHTYQCCQYSLSKVVAFGHNELWRQKVATVTTKLDKISPNGNTAEELRGPGGGGWDD